MLFSHGVVGSSLPQAVPEAVSDGRHAEDYVKVPLDVLEEDPVQVGERSFAAYITTGGHLETISWFSDLIGYSSPYLPIQLKLYNVN